MEEEDGIEENSASGGEGSRWVDGSEVDSETAGWVWPGENEAREGQDYGSMRRRLVKKPKRVDSFDVEAMEVADAHGHHPKVNAFTLVRPLLLFFFFFFLRARYFCNFT